MSTSKSTGSGLISVLLPADLSPYLDRIKSEASSSSTLPERLLTGAAVALRVNEKDALLIITIGPTVDGVQSAFWIAGLIGSFGMKPKANFDIMRQVLSACEKLALASGCSEIRIETAYRSGWKRTLLPLFGFSAHEVDGMVVMRKVLSWA